MGKHTTSHEQFQLQTVIELDWLPENRCSTCTQEIPAHTPTFAGMRLCPFHRAQAWSYVSAELQQFAAYTKRADVGGLAV
jgi:hypothetical protein